MRFFFQIAKTKVLRHVCKLKRKEIDYVDDSTTLLDITFLTSMMSCMVDSMQHNLALKL